MSGAPFMLVGEGDLADEVRDALGALDADVLRLVRPTQREIESAFARGPIARVVVVGCDDATALRNALMVRSADAGVELLVTYFDLATAGELRDRVGNCRTVSMADIVAPTLAAPCLDPALGAIRLREDGRPVGLVTDGATVREVAVDIPHRLRIRSLVSALLKPYDRSAALLLYGALGLLVILLVETVAASIVLDQHILDAFYGAAKTLVTVDPNDKVADGPRSFQTFIAVLMLVALLFEAFFTAGIVNRLIDRRLTGLVGRRAVPRQDHVIVVGLGEVGLRLCLLLRELGVAVVAVDPHEDGEDVGQAREAGLPVIIGRGADPSLLQRLCLPRALAVAAVTEDDLVNLSVGMAALSMHADTRIVLRVGDGRLANETRSLFEFGVARDVHRIAAGLIAAQATGSAMTRVICRDEEVHLADDAGGVRAATTSAPA